MVPLTIIILGATRSGKTALVNSLLGGKFTKDHNPTMGVDIKFYHSQAQFIDTSGEARFEYIIEKYLERANIVIHCANLSKQQCEETQRCSATHDSNLINKCCDKDTSVIAVATKADLLGNKNSNNNANSSLTAIKIDHQKLYQVPGNGIQCHVCSSLTGQGIDELRQLLVSAIQSIQQKRMNSTACTQKRRERPLRTWIAAKHGPVKLCCCFPLRLRYARLKTRPLNM